MASGPELRGGTVTFLFTDVEGSTALLKRVGRLRYHELLGRHQALLRETFTAHGGEEIDTQGDAFFVAFASAADAAAAAAEIQRSLAADGEVRVRIGIHSGEASAAGGRYVGFSIHRASRIGAAGHGGQVLLSSATRELVEDDLPEGVSLRDLGAHRLKDVERPERISQLIVEGLPAGFPPLRGAQPLKPPPLRRRSLLAAALAGVIAAAIVIPVFTLSGGGGTALASIGPDSVGAINSTGHITDSIPANVSPTEIAFGGGAVWVTSAEANSVVEIDPQTGSKVQTISVGKGPIGVAYGGRFVWVADSLDGTLQQIDPGSQKVVNKTYVGNGPTAVAYGDGFVWVANSGDRNVKQIDPRTLQVKHTFSADAGADALAVSKDAVLWVVSESDGTVTRIDPRRPQLPPSVVHVGNGPTAVAVGFHAVWVANGLDGTVSRISPSSYQVTDTVQVGAFPSGIAVDDHAVWVTNEESGTVSRIEPANHDQTALVERGNRPVGLAAAGDTVYVAVQASAQAHRGGTLRVVEAAPFPYPVADIKTDVLDPAYQLAYQGYETLSLTNDGLVAFKHAGGTEGTRPVPDLATRIPTPSDGGKTYSFEVRSGVHYSDRQLVQPADFRRAIRRTLLAGVGPYYTGIQGAAECVRAPKRCDLRQGIVTTGDTITFHLTARDPDFLFKLAMPWAYAVPPHAGLPVPATGPYMITDDFDHKSGMTLVRNPQFKPWSAAAQPEGVPDRITFDWTGTRESQAHAVEEGHADVLLENGPNLTNLSPALVKEARTGFATQTHIDPVLAIDYFVLNTRRLPFNNPKARQAVNYAVDRKKVIALGGQPQIYYRPTCQLLPPGLEGYSRIQCKHDIRKAQRLVRASGTRGATVTVLEVFGSMPFYQYFIRVLDSLGYRARLEPVAKGDNPYDILNDSSQAPQVAAIPGWLMDFTSPAGGLLTTLLTCAAFTRGDVNNPNQAEFCDRSIDAKIRVAGELQQTEFGAAAHLWVTIDQALTAQAPLIAIDNQRSLTLVSPRVGNYTYNLVWSVPFLDQLWVKGAASE